MNVENRKLFRNKDARSRLASMGGIMGSSPELLGTVQKFQEAGPVAPSTFLVQLPGIVDGNRFLQLTAAELQLLNEKQPGLMTSEGVMIQEATPESLSGLNPMQVNTTNNPNIKKMFAELGVELPQEQAPVEAEGSSFLDTIKSYLTPSGESSGSSALDELRAAQSGIATTEGVLAPSSALDELRATRADIATREGIGTLPPSSALDELRAARADIATREGIRTLPVSPGEQPFVFSDITGVSRDGRTNEEILAQARSLMPQPNRDSSGSLLPVAEPVAAPSFQSLPMNVAADSGPESGMFSDDVKGGFNIMPPAPYLSEAEQLLQQEPRVSGPFANVPRNYGTGIEAAQLNAMETGDVSLPVTSSEQLLTDNSDQGGLLSSIKSFAGDVIGDLKEGGVKYFDKRIAQQDASDIEETADLSRLQANYQGILDKLAGGNLSDNQRAVLNRRKLALEEQYDANILATAIDPKNISRRITGALAKAGGNILAATGGDDETAVDVLDAADAMAASATTGKLDTLEAIRTAEAEAREQGQDVDPTLLAALAKKIETPTTERETDSVVLEPEVKVSEATKDTLRPTVRPPNLLDVKTDDPKATTKSFIDAALGAPSDDPKKNIKSYEAQFREMLGIKDKDKAKEMWHNLSMIGFAIAAGQDPSALANIAQGMLEGTKMMKADRDADEKLNQDIASMAFAERNKDKRLAAQLRNQKDIASIRSSGAPSTYTDERLRQSIIAKLPTTIDDYEDLGLVTDNKVDFKLVEKYIQNQMRLGSSTAATSSLTNQEANANALAGGFKTYVFDGIEYETQS